MSSNIIYYIIYETTNHVNGRKYRGVHKTSNLNDGHIGSGKLLKQAIIKYGIENFSRTILACALSENHMYELESIFVTPEWIIETNAYNIKSGGFGGYRKLYNGVETAISSIPEIKLKLAETMLSKYGYKSNLHSPTNQSLVKSALLEKYGVDNPLKIDGVAAKVVESRKEIWDLKYGGHPMYDKDIIHKANTNRAASIYDKYGVDNIANLPEVSEKKSKKMKNKVWINNGATNKRIDKESIQTWLSSGWIVGRLSKPK